METLIAAAIAGAVTLVETVIKLAANAGFSEADCEAAKQKALVALQAIDSSMIAAEAREWILARGGTP